MANVYGARLDRSQTPAFADRCVCCGADRPGHQARFFAGGDYGVFFPLLWLQDGTKSIVAPACPGCALGSRIHGLLRFAVAALSALVATWVLFWIVPNAAAVDHVKCLGLVMAAVVPALVWNQIFPPRFALSTDDNVAYIDYRFPTAAAAEEFRRMNRGKE
jgi:hypothetical protein